MGTRRRFTSWDAEAFRVAHHRQKNGLEYRTLVALAHAPRALELARKELHPHDFIGAPYSMLAGILLSPETPASVLKLAHESIAGHPYLPDPHQHPWEEEAEILIAEMLNRKERFRLKEQKARKDLKEITSRAPWKDLRAGRQP